MEFSQSNNLQGDKIQESVNELNEVVKKVDYAICKCQAKFLMQQHKNELNQVTFKLRNPEKVQKKLRRLRSL